jgi:hypothetical protein
MIYQPISTVSSDVIIIHLYETKAFSDKQSFDG